LEEVEAAILALKAEYPSWGGRRIAVRLIENGYRHVPAPSTITEVLRRRGLLQDRMHNDVASLEWLSGLWHARVEAASIPEWAGSPDLPILLDKLRSGTPMERKRAIVVLATRRGLRQSLVCRHLDLSPSAFRWCATTYAQRGVETLFARKINPYQKVDDEGINKAVFATLHQPPSSFGINRTTWTMAELSRVLREQGHPVGEDTIRRMVRAAGYRWRKARVVLTSNDPQFSEKVTRIKGILSRLREDEAFFSIDEYGPFAVKRQPGRQLVREGERPSVPQWQRSKGSVIVTAALELSTNQVTHFYSSKKNTAEMVRMMEVLTDRYRFNSRIYLSWDAASWHVSKELFRRVEDHNSNIGTAGPKIEPVPLPARAQFLNVIEAVFSGIARAIIHNSDYQSVEEAKTAVDRYFSERNAHFLQHPRRAGKRMWASEPVPAEFSESANCKAAFMG